MRYTDELDAVRAREQELRRRIAAALAAEAGSPAAEPDQAALHAAGEAIATWRETGEEQADLAAFRPLTPLQQLLVEHALIMERIVDTLDRRLS